MLSNLDLTVLSLVAIVAAIVVVNDAACKPLTICPFVVTNIFGRQLVVGLIEYLRWHDFLFKISNSNVDLFCCLETVLIECLHFE